MRAVALERTTDVAAAAGVASVWWYPILKEISGIAATGLPILGFIWIAVQIAHKISRWHK